MPAVQGASQAGCVCCRVPTVQAARHAVSTEGVHTAQSGMLVVRGCPGHMVCAWHGVCGGWQCQGHWCGAFPFGSLQSSGQHHLNSFLSQQYVQPAVQNHSHPALTRPCTEQAVIALESIRCPASTGTSVAREQKQGKWLLQGCASTEAVGAGAMRELLVPGYRTLGPWQDAASCPEVPGDHVSPIPPPSQHPPPPAPAAVTQPETSPGASATMDLLPK